MFFFSSKLKNDTLFLLFLTKHPFEINNSLKGNFPPYLDEPQMNVGHQLW